MKKIEFLILGAALFGANATHGVEQLERFP